MSNETKKPEVVGLMTSNKEDFFASAVIEQEKRNSRRWFTICVILLIALVGTNAYWIYDRNSYDYVIQDGEGQNNYNHNIDGDVENVTGD